MYDFSTMTSETVRGNNDDTTGKNAHLWEKVLQLRNWSWPKLGSNFGNLQKLQADDADAVN